VAVFGLAGYTTMDAAPASLAFAAIQGAGSPAAQAVTISNSGTGSLSWSAAADSAWIAVTPSSGASAPSSTLNVGVNTTGLSAGTYNGKVAVAAGSGATETVSVQLTVTPPPAILSVTPASLAFTAQQNGSTPPAKTIAISNLGGDVMAWTAKKSQPWLSLNPTSGTAPSSIEATVNMPLAVGTYTDAVIISAAGSQAQVNVTMTVGNTGTVTITTNLSQAGFTMTGPAPATTSLTGSGTLWKNDTMMPGDYTVSFNHVTGYKKPASKTITVTSGKETAVAVDYLKKTAATHIAAVTGGALNKKVSVLTVAGEPVSSFKAFVPSTAGIMVASGDLDGSGTDKIVVANNQRRVRVLSADGTELAAFVLPVGFKNSAIAVGDLDNDGKAEVLLGALVDRIGKPDIRTVKLLAYSSGKLEEKATLFTEEKNGMFRLAIGDVDGDLKADVVMADRTGVRAFGVANGALGQLWSVQGAFAVVPEVAAGDVNDDGMAEIVLSTPGVIQVLKGTGEPTGVLITTPKTALNPTPASVACGDTDGDGLDDIAVGSTGGAMTVPKVQLYKGDGTALGAPIEVKNAGGFGATVSLGSF
jgi:hypothetical protein